MTAFVESCVETAAGSAVAAERKARGQPKVTKLLRLLTGKKKILVTAHQHPDPDALASGMAMCTLLAAHLPGVTIVHSVRGKIGGGLNDAFVKHAGLQLAPWDDAALDQYDAIVLVDTQPTFTYSPLPQNVQAMAVIDHHRARGRRPACPFCDIRPDVGATSSIVFSYFMETETPINSTLAATLVYGIESDLAGAAGTPGQLDNIALSSLTLLADTRKLYQMRYVDLPQSYYIAYHEGLSHAVWYDDALITHLGEIDSLEKTAVVADFLLRFDQVHWSLVTAVHEQRLIVSLRSDDSRRSAADVMRRLMRHLGEGGGHRTKAGGAISLDSTSMTEIDRKQTVLLRRYLRALGIKQGKPHRLVPEQRA
ncbi:MAG TPA: DHH family phosphoesterase [Tepidisphaeraceae bacterium]|nr:DHH family phosphoesterase [Tepidisphaeraceae bacterium]